MEETDDLLKRAIAAYFALAAKPAPPPAPVYIAPDRYGTIRLYSSISGLSADAIRSKIKIGKWLENREFIRAPDGGIFIDREGVAKWLRRGS